VKFTVVELVVVKLKLNFEKSGFDIKGVPATCPIANSKKNKNNIVLKNFIF
jgi:hypothetical protein